MRSNWPKSVALVVLLSTIAKGYGATNDPTSHIPPAAEQAIEIQEQLNALRAVADELSSHLEDMRKHWYQVPQEQREMVNKIDKWTHEEQPKLQAIVEKITAEKWGLAAQSESRFFNELTLLIAAMGVVLAVLGLLSYQVLYHKLKMDLDNHIRDRMDDEHRQATAAIQKEVNRNLAKLYNGLSMMFSEQYHDLKPMTVAMGNAGESQLVHHLYEFTLQQAIELAKATLDRVKLLHPQEYEAQILSGKQTFAYHLATRNKANDFETALTLSAEVFDKVPKYKALGSNSWYHWVETYAWVLCHSSINEDKEKSKLLIADLMRNTDIEFAWRNKVHKKYRDFTPGMAINPPPSVS